MFFSSNLTAAGIQNFFFLSHFLLTVNALFFQRSPHSYDRPYNLSYSHRPQGFRDRGIRFQRPFLEIFEFDILRHTTDIKLTIII
jgi:hypothetical protein